MEDLSLEVKTKVILATENLSEKLNPDKKIKKIEKIDETEKAGTNFGKTLKLQFSLSFNT